MLRSNLWFRFWVLYIYIFLFSWTSFGFLFLIILEIIVEDFFYKILKIDSPYFLWLIRTNRGKIAWASFEPLFSVRQRAHTSPRIFFYVKKIEKMVNQYEIGLVNRVTKIWVTSLTVAVLVSGLAGFLIDRVFFCKCK